MLTSMWDKNNYIMLVLAMSNSFHWQINNVLTKNEICTLTNAIIANPTQTSLFFSSSAIQGFVAFNAIKTKERSYCY